MALGQQIIVEQLLTRVAEYRASDLHLTIGSNPVLRLDGKLVTLTDEQVVTPELMESALEQLLTREQRQQLENNRSLVFTYALGTKARFKVNVFYQKGYPSLSLRYINAHIRTIPELGLPAVVEGLARLQKGLVIVAGSFGSGRSATLAALIETVNRERAEHIVTIEQPIEHLFENKKSIVEQREVGRDAVSFEQALENLFQEDVNVVMVSELQSSSVIASVLQVAESSRLIFTTMNTDSAIKTIEKILTSFPAAEQQQVQIQLSEVLQGIVVQTLVPKIGGGITVVAEVLTVTPAIRAVIRDGAFQQIQTILQTSREEGMVPLDRALADRVKAGEVTMEEALARATDAGTLKMMLRPAYPQ